MARVKRWEEKCLEANPKQAPRRAGNTGRDSLGWQGWWGRASPGTEQELWQVPRLLEPGLQRGHIPLKVPVPLLLLQLVASSPAGHTGFCHVWLHISAALGEDEPLPSLFPLKVNQGGSKRSGESWRNRGKERRGSSQYEGERENSPG